MKKWLIGFLALAVLAIALWLAYVRSSEWTPRARIMDSMSGQIGLQVAITQFRSDEGRFPNSLDDLGEKAPFKGRFVSSVSVEPGGVIVISFGGPESDTVISGQSFRLKPSIQEDGVSIAWSCVAPDIPLRHHPMYCREPWITITEPVEIDPPL